MSECLGVFGAIKSGEAENSKNAKKKQQQQQSTVQDTSFDIFSPEIMNQMLSGSSKKSNSSVSGALMPKLDDIKLELTDSQQREIASFKSSYEQNKEIYERVGKATNLPPKLIASMHYREGSLDFNKTIKDGGALSSGANWEKDAIATLSKYDKQGLTYDSTDVSKCLEFAERYNGLGYRNAGKVSAYTLAGTKNYNDVGGMYVKDGEFNPNAKDKRPGVYALLTHGMNPVIA